MSSAVILSTNTFNHHLETGHCVALSYRYEDEPSEPEVEEGAQDEETEEHEEVPDTVVGEAEVKEERPPVEL